MVGHIQSKSIIQCERQRRQWDSINEKWAVGKQCNGQIMLLQWRKWSPLCQKYMSEQLCFISSFLVILQRGTLTDFYTRYCGTTKNLRSFKTKKDGRRRGGITSTSRFLCQQHVCPCPHNQYKIWGWHHRIISACTAPGSNNHVFFHRSIGLDSTIIIYFPTTINELLLHTNLQKTAVD